MVRVVEEGGDLWLGAMAMLCRATGHGLALSAFEAGGLAR